jgi:hypothetical protein
MTAPSSALSKRLGKLFPVLSSDKDGEVLAAVRAISGAIAAEGLDWHDLAATVSSTLEKRLPVSAAVAPPSSFSSMSHFERLAWLDALLAVDWLTPYERDRVQDTRNRVWCGLYYRLHGRTKNRIDALIARAEGLGVRP